jgi:hypothetical protein
VAAILTLDEVGRIVSYVAPGYLAQWVYRARYPSRDRPAGELLIMSVALSVPFVALASRLTSSSNQNPTSLRFVAALFIPALIVGFAAAIARPALRVPLVALGFSEQPEGSIWQRTLHDLPKDAWVTIDLVDGSKVAGLVRTYPGAAADGVRELFLVAPRFDDGEELRPVNGAAGVIVRLDEVRTVTLGRDPTDALV